MKNREIAGLFRRIADMLEVQGGERFRIAAYRKAADTLEALTMPVEEVSSNGTLSSLPHIGKGLEEKINEYLKTGKISFYDELKREIPDSVMRMMDVPGVGPKTVNLLYEKLKIVSLEQLKEKIQKGDLDGVPGMGSKKLENILKGIDFVGKAQERILLSTAGAIRDRIIGSIKGIGGIRSIESAGSLRRCKETIGDIDILAVSTRPQKVMDAFVGLPDIRKVLAYGPTKSSILTGEDIQVDLRVVEKDSYGAALAYLTGSKEHNVKLREIAIKRGLKLNEYGVFREIDGKKIAGKDEKGVYEALGLSFIPPEMREDRGEIELAQSGKIPRLIQLNDIKGDLHVHSEYSDGNMRMEDIRDACIAKGYKYLAITDHSVSLRVGRGLDIATLKAKNKKIEAINKRAGGFRILKGAEVDILKDGSMDYSDEDLAGLDFVVGAIHTGFTERRDELTRRIIKAMRNPRVHMIAHLTGRLLGRRQGYELDAEEILKAARETNTVLEINANPERLDIDDITAKRAVELKVPVAITTDSHEIGQLDHMMYGVSVARRAWMARRDVLNTLGTEAFLKKLK